MCRVKHWKIALVIWAVLSASLALAEDFKTIDGKEYKNAKVSRVEPDGIVLLTKSGISKVYFTELPKEVQERFHYDAPQAAQFTSQTVEQNRLAQERKIEEDAKRAEEVAKRKAEQEVLRQQRDAEMRRQQREAEQQRQRRDAEQQQQAQIQRAPASTPSVSKEGIPEHTYEILQDHTISFGDVRIRLRRGEQYHGRILVDHAEIDIKGISYNVPSGILSAPKD
jgi:TolA-binding protein